MQFALASRAQVTLRERIDEKNCGLPRTRTGCSCVLRSWLKQQLEQFFHSKKSMGLAWEAIWPFTCASDILHRRATAKELNATKKCGPCGEVFFFLMRRETDTVEAAPHRHASTECLFFFPWLSRMHSVSPEMTL